MRVSLTAADSMMGDETLPANGILVARLDADGSVTTKQPGDLEVEAAAVAGEMTTLVFGR
jgi:hypothetical protein